MNLIKNNFIIVILVRNKTLINILPYIAAFTLSACTGPLSSEYTARSLGENTLGLNGGLSTAINGDVQGYLRAGYGITDNADIGLVGEVGDEAILGLWGKYSFINHPDQYSFAITGGSGYTSSISNIKGGGVYFWAGPIVSYKFIHWDF